MFLLFLSEQLILINKARTTVSQDVQTRLPVQLAFAKFLSKIKGNFGGSAGIHDTGTVLKVYLYFR